MKKYIVGFLSLLFVVTMYAQQTTTPNGINQSISTSQEIAEQSTQNYIRTYTYRNSTPSLSNPQHVNVDIQYLDGLGRPIETVSVKASPTGKDIVSVQTYDAYGRADKTYIPLPYSSSNNGRFVTESTVATGLYYSLSGLYELIGSDASYGFSQPEYEPSPLNRVLKQGAPGAEWQVNSHPVEYEYKTNTSTIPYYKYTGDAYNTDPYYYPIRSLYITETTDEDSTTTKTYTDFEGKVVMKEAYDGLSWLKTRYCYDDFGLLRCVLQPLAASPANTGYCFYYKYDDLNRPIETGYITTSAVRDTIESHFNLNFTPYASATYSSQQKMSYDNYSAVFLGSWSFVADDMVSTEDTISNPIGLMTLQSSKEISDQNSFAYKFSEVYYYDKLGRVIQKVNIN